MERSVAACVPRVHVRSVEEQVFQVLNHPVSTNLHVNTSYLDDDGNSSENVDDISSSDMMIIHNV